MTNKIIEDTYEFNNQIESEKEKMGINKTKKRYYYGGSKTKKQGKIIRHIETKKRYKILPYTYKRAKKLGVKVESSDNLKYKLKVTTKDGKIIYCGGNGYSDYPTYIKKFGLEYANKRRKLYKIRHKKDRHIRNTPGFMADYLLW